MILKRIQRNVKDQKKEKAYNFNLKDWFRKREKEPI